MIEQLRIMACVGVRLKWNIVRCRVMYPASEDTQEHGELSFGTLRERVQFNVLMVSCSPAVGFGLLVFPDCPQIPGLLSVIVAQLP